MMTTPIWSEVDDAELPNFLIFSFGSLHTETLWQVTARFHDPDTGPFGAQSLAE